MLSRMVDVKSAVANAIQFAKVSLGPERTAGIRLEEVESASIDGKQAWLITLSAIPVERQSLPEFAAVYLGADAGREYKVFAIDKDTGEVLSMKMRLLQTAIAS